MIFKLAHIATFIFILMKVFALEPVVAWSWWVVLAPSLVCITLGLVIIAGYLYAASK